jgi:hypothetical protein
VLKKTDVASQKLAESSGFVKRPLKEQAVEEVYRYYYP